MAISKFRDPLSEDRLSERERDERIRSLDQFSQRLKKEMRTAAFEDRIAIRQSLVYVGKRLDLLDLENRHARGMAQYDSLLARTTKPVPQGLVGVTADALLDLGLCDREKIARRHEEETEALIEKISILAPEIDRLLDQRQSPDKENYVLRPSSCLPEAAIRDEDALSKSGNTPELPSSDTAPEPPEMVEPDTVEAHLVDTAHGEISLNKNRSNSPGGKGPRPNPTTQQNEKGSSKAWLDQKKSPITVHGKPYVRNHMADMLMQMNSFSEKQRDVAVLCYGYESDGHGMSDTEISTLLHCTRKTVYGHRKTADSKIAQAPALVLLLSNYKRKKRRSEEEEDTSRSE